MLSSQILMLMRSRVIPLIEYMHIYNMRALCRIMLAYTLNIELSVCLRAGMKYEIALLC